MRRATLIAAKSAACLLVLICAAWGALFLWFQMPGGPIPAGIGAALWSLGSLAAFFAVLRRRRHWLGLYAAGFAGLLAWFLVIQPSNDRDWAQDVARPLLADIEGHAVVIHDVRDFTWTSADAGRPAWRSGDTTWTRSRASI